ncbi:hypothetical protein AVEN_242320-1 [Araneus ventricosus]|uniref:Uncharacterized protein n=1 Tax=Araneus ventricosus TaxID=182803 RepID=A0A4Y2KWG9_ARAVE|nr:hypothetical protein AVEN_242320-1 [Araneus ventricosus]
MNRGNKINPSVLLIFNGDAHDGVHGDDDAHDDVRGGVRGGGDGHDDGDDHGGVRGDGDDGLLDRQRTGMWRTCIAAQGREQQKQLLRISGNVKHNPSFSYIH